MGKGGRAVRMGRHWNRRPTDVTGDLKDRLLDGHLPGHM